MIDIHCHILPGVDDGARHLEEAVQMARIAEKQGVTGIVATPHFMKGGFSPSVESVSRACSLLQDALREVGVSVDIYPGMEVYLCPQLDEMVRLGETATLNQGGRYLLVELPFDSVPLYCEQVLFSLLVDGVTPVLAHPERYDSLPIDTLARWIEQGLVVQVNSGSFTGFFGQRVQRKAERLLLSNLVHLVASDAHSAGRRSPMLTAARQQVATLAGADMARELFSLNPQKIVSGEQIIVKPFRPVTGVMMLRRRLQMRRDE